MAEKTKKPDRGSQALKNYAYLRDKQALIGLLHNYESEVKSPSDVLPFVEKALTLTPYQWELKALVDGGSGEEVELRRGVTWRCRRVFFDGVCDGESCVDCLSADFSLAIPLDRQSAEAR